MKFIFICMVSVILTSLSACVPPPPSSPAPSPTPVIQIIEVTSTPMPSTPTLTPTFTLTNTPLPPPLEEIFPQVDGGQEFSFANEGGVLTFEFVIDPNCTHSGPYGLRIAYSMLASGNGGWGVHWDNSQDGYFNSFPFTNLSFWVKGATGNESFQIAMKDTDKNEYWITSTSVFVTTPDWTQVSIPLSKFEKVNMSSLANMSFGFNKDHKSGSICIDDISFVNK